MGRPNNLRSTSVVHVYTLPTRQDIERFAGALSDSRLECRSWGHEKKMRSVREVMFEGSDQIYFECSFFCERGCDVTWLKIFNKDTGQEVYSGTRYPREYLATGIGRLSGAARAIVRLESINRADIEGD